MVVVPALTPVTTPAPDGAIVATAVLLLVQPPPPLPSIKVVVDPWHTKVVPVMVAGIAFTRTEMIFKHPVPRA